MSCYKILAVSHVGRLNNRKKADFCAMKGKSPCRLKKNSIYLAFRAHLVPFLLDFAEDDVHVSEGDVLAVNHAAVLAEL